MTAGSGLRALRIVRAVTAAIAVSACFGQKPDAQPREINPGGPGKAPSDAVVLFDGKDMSHWTTRDGKPALCQVHSGEMVCLTGVGDIYSREKFRSAQIHLEFAIPFMPEQKDQMRGNSGVYLHGKYEIQILDSYHNPTYAVGACGAIYGQSPPLVNASRPPEQWQSYDIIFHAAKCDAAGKPTVPATVTVLHNGVLVQDHVKVEKSTGCGEEGPLMLQDHSGFPGAPQTSMKFRDIWIRRLEE